MIHINNIISFKIIRCFKIFERSSIKKHIIHIFYIYSIKIRFKEVKEEHSEYILTVLETLLVLIRLN